MFALESALKSFEDDRALRVEREFLR